MKHLGDITKINGAEIEPVDCITFGSPCQDLSVAGTRKGLAGERSGLFMQAARVIKEMREATNGKYPTFAVWENVCGAFSSNRGEDFRAVLEELVRLADPNAAIPRPESGRWGRAGYIGGDGFSVAWRQLDAQYWGVPQRRKRIALVMDFAGQRAGKILFERESLRGNTAQSCPPWKEVASAPQSCAGADYSGGGQVYDARGNGGGDIAPTMTGDHNGHLSDYTAIVVEETTATLTSRYDGSPNGDGNTPLVVEAAGFLHGQSAKARGLGYEAERAPTLLGGAGGNQKPCVVYAIGSYHSNAWKSGNPHSGIYEAETARTLDAFGNANPARNQGGMAICEQVQAYGISRATFNQGDGAHYGLGIEAECQPTITAQGPAAVCKPIMCRAAQGASETLVEKAPCLTCDHEQHIVLTRWRVRRLTPLECERLQGYPDGWTDIGEWTDSKGKKRKPADTPRYKALGNSIALPQWWWLTCKMADYLPQSATLGSLFDGIGGFPLVWETRHGKGAAKWASEIEEFCIAVTKARFGNG